MRTLLLSLLLLPIHVLVAQSSKVDLQARLVGKPLFLSGQWTGNDLKFDAGGAVLIPTGNAPFTLSAVDVRGVRLDAKGLRLDAERMAMLFSGDKWSLVRVGGRVRLEIAAPADGNYAAALDRIFFTSPAQYVPQLPRYWQFYGEQHLLPEPLHPNAKPGSLAGNAAVSKVGGGVVAPRVIFGPEPRFDDAARAKKISGTVLIYMQVDERGDPQAVQIVRPLGLGLDENAADAAQSYRFKPATRDGVPVRVELQIEVNFQIL